VSHKYDSGDFKSTRASRDSSIASFSSMARAYN
jgi:hypothetical protein